jgi:hypothetical protein
VWVLWGCCGGWTKINKRVKPTGTCSLAIKPPLTSVSQELGHVARGARGVRLHPQRLGARAAYACGLHATRPRGQQR